MTAPPRFDPHFERQLAELFDWRRDVRRFRSDPLEPDVLTGLVRAAATAPSVGYSQPARFVRVVSPERRAAVIAAYERANRDALASYAGERAAQYAALKLSGLREAPEHLAVFCDEETGRGSGLGRATMPEMLAYSAVCAVHTLWLAARARGLGVGWVSIVDPAAVHAALDVAEAWRLIAYLCVGYPQEEHRDRELVRARWESDDPAAAALLTR